MKDGDQFVQAVESMRKAQIRFKKSKNYNDGLKASKLERNVDAWVDELADRPDEVIFTPDFPLE